MAKISGLGWTTLDVQDSTPTVQHIKNDVTQLDFSTPVAVQDITGVDKSAHERLDLLSDFIINLTGVFNTALSHGVFKDLRTNATRSCSLVIGGATLTNNVLFTDYNLTRAPGGDFTWKTTGSLADGAIPTWS